MKKLNQRIHEFLGKHGLLRFTNCIDRWCDVYHGTSPSQAVLFYLTNEEVTE